MSGKSANARIKAALNRRSRSSVLVALAQAFKAEGTPQREMYQLFDQYRAKHHGDRDEAKYDAILDTVDLIVGYCESWEELAHRDLDGKWGKNPSEEDVAGWIAAMQELHADLELGKQYVYLDGLIIPTGAAGVDFQGWHSEHRLDFVPQVNACEDRLVMEEILGNRDYWRRNAVPECEAP